MKDSLPWERADRQVIKPPVGSDLDSCGPIFHIRDSMIEEEEKQMVLQEILENSKGQELSVSGKKSRVKKARVKNKSGRKKTRSKFAVSLVHESGVKWRLDCLQQSAEELEPSHYQHLAKEGIKLELLRLLKQVKPSAQHVQIICLVLGNLGAELPQFLMVEQNKNLFEGDFWSSFEILEAGPFCAQASSFLWAFYFKEFGPNEVVAETVFGPFPADETDLMCLEDYNLARAKYPGITYFVDGLQKNGGLA